MDSEWRVRLLRAWYGLRERLGHPRKMTREEFDKAGPTTLLAGSPWVWTVNPPMTSGTQTATFVVTNTTWSTK